MGGVCLLCLVLACASGARGAEGAERNLRALLLQQSHAGDYRMTLFALEEAGFETTWVNKDRLDVFPASAEALRKRFDVVFFGSLATEGGIVKLLSANQLEALKRFIAEGGGLVTVIAEAGGALSDILPVTPGPAAGPMQFKPVVVASDHPALSGIPARWPVFGSKWNSFSKVTPKAGARVLMEIPASFSDKAYPFLAAWEYGKGRVVCMNSLWAFSTGRFFKNWEWAPAFFKQAGRWAAHLPPVPASQLKPVADKLWFWRYEREHVAGIAERLNRPVLTAVGPAPPGRVQVRLGDPKRTADIPIESPPEIRESDAMLVVTFGNGMVARLDKRGMVGYRTADGLVLAKDPVDEMPRILYSGATGPVKAKAEAGETFVLKEALPKPGVGRQRFQYVGHAVRGTAVEVKFQVIVDDRPEGEFLWRFVPRTQVVEGVEWRGVGEAFSLTSPRLFVEHVVPGHRWAVGGTVDGHFTFRFGCYSKPRGYHAVTFTDSKSQDAGHFRWFSSGQPFQMFGAGPGTLWCYVESPVMVASWLCNKAGSGYLRMVNNICIGRRRGRIELPVVWYMFSRARMDHNLWMSAYDFIRNKYRSDFGIRPMHPRPSAMARFNVMGFVDLRRYADILIPLCRRLGFKRIDCGVCYVHEAMNTGHGGVPALKYLCDRAHEAGIEVFFYCGSAWAKDNFPLLKQHPEWIIRNRRGAPLDTNYPHIFALSLRSGWRDYSLGKYAELKKLTGMDGVWLDSWTMPNEYVNYAEHDARPAVVESIRYVKALQDLGYTTWIEGQSPVGLDSFWYRHDRYADLRGNEFSLFNTSPFAYAGNGLFYLDLFRLLSYNCAMLQDPRLLYRPEDKITQVASKYNQLMNRIHETVGFPARVRECPFGTTWECGGGFVVFAHQSRNVDVSLPQGDYVLEQVDIPAALEPRKDEDGRVHIVGTIPARGVLIIKRR